MSTQPEQKIYVPKSSVKEVQFRNGGSMMKLSFKADAMIEFIKIHANEKGYVNLGITKRKTTSDYGDTHCLWLDTWKPQKQHGAPETPSQSVRPAQVEEGDVPF